MEKTPAMQIIILALQYPETAQSLRISYSVINITMNKTFIRKTTEKKVRKEPQPEFVTYLMTLSTAHITQYQKTVK
jgi:hypothetical protein